MNIFRYFGPQRVDCLEKEEVCFSPPTRFNDPFDLRPVFAPVTNRKYLKRIFRRGSGEIESRFASLPKSQRRKIVKRVRENSIAYYQANADRYAETYQQIFPETLDRYVGVLCCSAINDDLLMWAHYAGSHKGFVLEFDSENDEFKKLGDLHEVKYDKTRPIVDATKPVDLEFYIRKSPVWRDEHEYRILRHLNSCKRRSLDAGDFYFAPMPRSCVKAVYLGTRMDKDLVKQTSELMAGTPAHIYETRLHLQEFSLVFERIK
jgi:hypothetical protein